MPSNCCVPMCKSSKRRNPNLSFHKFPQPSEKVRIATYFGGYETVERRKCWINKTKVSNEISQNSAICSLHFTDSDFFAVYKCPRLKKTAIPSVNLPSQYKTTSTKCGERLTKRKEIKTLARTSSNENFCNSLELKVEEEVKEEIDDANETANIGSWEYVHLDHSMTKEEPIDEEELHSDIIIKKEVMDECELGAQADPLLDPLNVESSGTCVKYVKMTSPYKCETCGWPFEKLSNLRKHKIMYCIGIMAKVPFSANKTSSPS